MNFENGGGKSNRTQVELKPQAGRWGDATEMTTGQAPKDISFLGGERSGFRQLVLAFIALTN